MSYGLFDDLRHAYEEGRPFVLCTVIEVTGSSPGKSGQKMIVFSDGTTAGTVGGGVNEERTRVVALGIFSTGGTRILSFSLDNPLQGGEPICGGSVKVFLELQADRPRLVVFGGGHIGNVVARMAFLARYRVTLVDERQEFTSEEAVPEIDRRLCLPYEDSIEQAEIDEQTFVVIVTPGHVKDREVLERVLKTPAAYIGMIGSARKVTETKKALAASGVPAERLEAVCAPVGIYLGGEAPEEIAISILAQIVAWRNGLRLHFSRPSSGKGKIPQFP
ncbi:MAG: XdhC/CoxI family protein [Candidatus Ozemobacteraceae bacterium]